MHLTMRVPSLQLEVNIPNLPYTDEVWLPNIRPDADLPQQIHTARKHCFYSSSGSHDYCQSAGSFARAICMGGACSAVTGNYTNLNKSLVLSSQKPKR